MHYHRKTATGCWQWTSHIGTCGYAEMSVGGKKRAAHRLAYEELIGPIPNGLQLDHLCRNRGCINPLHLEPVTARENVRRGISPCADHARQTHCKYGHRFAEEKSSRGLRRRCQVCQRAAIERYQKSDKGVATMARQRERKLMCTSAQSGA